MENTLYTRLSEVSKVARDNYIKYHKRTAFIDIIHYLYENNLLLETPPMFRSSNEFLNTEQFKQHAHTMIVNARAILSDSQQAFIAENATIPTTKDIFVILQLPYIHADFHTHDYFEINYVYSGSCIQKFEKEERRFFEGDLIIIAPDSPHSILTVDDGLILCLNIKKSTFDKTFWQLINTNDILSAFFKHSLFGNNSKNYLTFTIGNASEYQILLQQIFDESNRNDIYSNNMSISLVNLFFGKLLREFGNTIQLYDINKTATFNNDFPMIMKYIQYNYNTVTLPILSQVFHYSEVYISKMFKKNLNQSFSITIQKLKLQYAKVYLENTNYKISKIAGLIGYESVDHLSRTFKKIYHITPSEFRKQLNRR